MAHAAPEKRANAEGARVSDRIEQIILGRIATGALAPGTRLPGERQLAEDMGASRVSVRAALQSLKAQGFLAAVQGGGTRVIASTGNLDPALTQLVRINHDNLRDLAEIRTILETWAARRAAENASAALIEELSDILRAMEADASRGARKAADDVRFHFAIAKASGSAIYMHIVGVIREILVQMVDYHRYELFPTPEEDHQILAHHRAIFEAVRGRDPTGAAAAMHDHLTWVAGHYRRAGEERGRTA